MSRYTNYDELLKELSKNPAPNPSDRCAQLLEAIINAPTADVVEVVRCRDCKNYRQNPYNEEEAEMLCMCWVDWLITDANDFCSYGERREQCDT